MEKKKIKKKSCLWTFIGGFALGAIVLYGFAWWTFNAVSKAQENGK